MTFFITVDTYGTELHVSSSSIFSFDSWNHEVERLGRIRSYTWTMDYCLHECYFFLKFTLVSYSKRFHGFLLTSFSSVSEYAVL